MAEKLVLSATGQADREKRYRIEVNELQLRTLIVATELVGRVGAGQLRAVHHVLPGGPRPLNDFVTNALDVAENHLRKEITSDGQCTQQSRISWDLYQVLRHHYAWERNPKGNNMDVSFDEPLKRSSEPLAIISSIEP